MQFFIMVLLLFPLLLHGAEPDFYVWQRNHGPAVEKAVRNYYNTCSGNLYFLAGEMENNGTVITLSPENYVDFKRAVPVVRIHIKHMRKSAAVLAAEVVKLYQPWKKTNALQIDLDAPESKILYYRNLMKELRSRLPGVKLSATVLPCHLKHTGDFRALAENCDYYVLQVHGLTKEGQRWFIMDNAIASRALVRAKSLKLPFKTALPFYCNTVRGGKLVTPDMNEVGRLAAGSPAVIGFRLGVSGDYESLDLQTALKVCRGEKYHPSLKFYWEKSPRGVWHFMVRNDGYFPRTVTMACSWKKEISYLNMGMFNGAEFSSDKKSITFILPPSGEAKPYFWVRSEDPVKTALFTIQQ